MNETCVYDYEYIEDILWSKKHSSFNHFVYFWTSVRVKENEIYQQNKMNDQIIEHGPLNIHIKIEASMSNKKKLRYRFPQLMINCICQNWITNISIFVEFSSIAVEN